MNLWRYYTHWTRTIYHPYLCGLPRNDCPCTWCYALLSFCHIYVWSS